MRERDDVEGVAAIGDGEFFADDVGQFVEGDELLDRELADGDDERGPEQRDLGVEPARAIDDLLRVRHAVAAGGVLAGEAAADRGHVDRRAKLRLGHPAGALEPAEERLPRRPREGAPEHRLLRARRLADGDARG